MTESIELMFVHIVYTLEFFAIKDLAVSARSGRPKSEFYVCLSVDTWYLKMQVHSSTSLLPLLVSNIFLYISTTSKNYNLYLPDLAETAKFLFAKNWIKSTNKPNTKFPNKALGDFF